MRWWCVNPLVYGEIVFDVGRDSPEIEMEHSWRLRLHLGFRWDCIVVSMKTHMEFRWDTAVGWGISEIDVSLELLTRSKCAFWIHPYIYTCLWVFLAPPFCHWAWHILNPPDQFLLGEFFFLACHRVVHQRHQDKVCSEFECIAWEVPFLDLGCSCFQSTWTNT